MKEIETKTLSREERRRSREATKPFEVLKEEAPVKERVTLQSPNLQKPKLAADEKPLEGPRSRLARRQKETGQLSTDEARDEQRPKKLRIRLIPIWLRVVIVLVLILVFFFIGAMIGYGVIGDGKPTDVFKKDTWSHIFDIINEGTDGAE